MLDRIIEQYGDDGLLKADGFDEAVIGVAINFTEPSLIYSVTKCLEILEREMSSEDAMEHFTFNVSGAYIGEKTPIWCWDDF
tara:strand:- start:731 stop:976 length:246 start_codon:yes stop_codon:yes gene_type:complete